MKNLAKAIFVLLTIAASFTFVSAQTPADSKDEIILPPAEEKFQETDALATLWRSSGCSRLNYDLREPNCHLVTGKEYMNTDMMTLYNEDGSLWYGFSVNFKSPDNFRKKMKKEFLPFVTYPSPDSVVVLRMVGESANWYKVEINEETREIKFILKNDPMWAKIKWHYLLVQMKFLKFDDKNNPIRDAPDGKIIEEFVNIQSSYTVYLKTEGDWALVVPIGHSEKKAGWIQWRKGRELLVKPKQDLFTFATSKTNSENQ